jgi:hypothetical protein
LFGSQMDNWMIHYRFLCWRRVLLGWTVANNTLALQSLGKRQ